MQIKNSESKRVILSALGDDDIIKILNSTKDEPKSSIELIGLHNFSHSTAYRKIKWMLDNGLLIVEKIEFTPDGKKFSLLKSTISSVKINYENESVDVELIENVKLMTPTVNQFFSLEE